MYTSVVLMSYGDRTNELELTPAGKQQVEHAGRQLARTEGLGDVVGILHSDFVGASSASVLETFFREAGVKVTTHSVNHYIRSKTLLSDLQRVQKELTADGKAQTVGIVVIGLGGVLEKASEKLGVQAGAESTPAWVGTPFADGEARVLRADAQWRATPVAQFVLK